MAAKMLTDTAIKAIRPPATGRVAMADGGCRGLEIRVTAAGERSWSFRFRDQAGATLRKTIGRYPDLGLADARDLANKHRAEVAAGGDPIETARQKREAARQAKSEVSAYAWEAFAAAHVARQIKRGLRSWAEDERMLKLHITPRWAGRDYRQIMRADCIDLLAEIAATGKLALAYRMRPLLSGMFQHALDGGKITASPASRLPKPSAPVRRKRYLSEPETRLMWAATSEGVFFSPMVALALRLILVTGVRPGEAAGMRVDELSNLDKPSHALWLIPASRMKGKRPHKVPLTPVAVSIIRDAMSITGVRLAQRDASPVASRGSADAQAVFASRYGLPGGDAMKANALARAMARLRDEVAKPAGGKRPAWADAEGWATWSLDAPHPHDLRRTAATLMSRIGVRSEVVQEVLAHARQDVAGKHYDHNDWLADKRHALARLASELDRIIEARPDETVVPIRPMSAGAVA